MYTACKKNDANRKYNAHFSTSRINNSHLQKLLGIDFYSLSKEEQNFYLGIFFAEIPSIDKQKSHLRSDLRSCLPFAAIHMDNQKIILSVSIAVLPEGPESNSTDFCGSNFCPGETVQDVNPNLAPPPASKINLIAGIYLACMAIATLIVALGLDSLTR